MTPSLPNAFELLLKRLDNDLEIAAEKYEILRLKLVKAAGWKGCPDSQADHLADVVLDRLAAKIQQGEQIENVNAYASTVLGYVWLEFSRKRKEDAAGDELPVVAVEPELPAETDLRLVCLRKCVPAKIPDLRDREFIIEYYNLETGEKLKDIRRALAEKYELTKEQMKIKAYRLRERLEKCINICLENSGNIVTKPSFSGTYQRSEGGSKR